MPGMKEHLLSFMSTETCNKITLKTTIKQQDENQSEHSG